MIATQETKSKFFSPHILYMPRRSRRGYAPPASPGKIAKFYAPRVASHAIRYMSPKPSSNPFIRGKIGPWTTKGRKKKEVMKEGFTGQSSTGKSFSKCGSYKPIPAALRYVSQQMNYYNDKGALTWVNGLQNYAIPKFVLHASDLSQWYQNATDLSLNATNATSTKIFVESVSGHITFKNHNNTQCVMNLYECIMKQTVNNNPINLIKDGVAVRFGENGSTSTKYQLLGMTPQMSETFNKHVKIIQGKQVILDPGQVHQHTYRYNYGKNFAVSHYFNELDNNTNQFIGGWTRFLLVKGVGTPDTTTTGVTVGSSSGKIIYTMDEKVYYRLSNTVKDKSAASGTISTLATEQTMVEDTDTSQAVISL